jgi:UDP-N-acetylglucosamine enolpyruvyl transferase
VAASS